MSNSDVLSTEDAQSTKPKPGPWWPFAPRRRVPTIKRAVQNFCTGPPKRATAVSRRRKALF